MSGLIPAIPLIVIRPFLPEFAWQEKREAGTLKRPSIAELFCAELRRTTIVTTMFTCSFAAAFGAIQQMPLIVPGLPECVRHFGAVEKAFADAQKAMAAKLPAEGKAKEEADERCWADSFDYRTSRAAARSPEGNGSQRSADSAVDRLCHCRARSCSSSVASCSRMFLIPGLIVMPLVFGWAAVTDLHYCSNRHVSRWRCSTVAQFSLLGNYLPHAYPVHLRGTGESFAANIGGRLIGTCFFGVTQWIAFFLAMGDQSTLSRMVAYTAAGVAFTVYVINFIASFWLPEPEPDAMTTRMQPTLAGEAVEHVSLLVERSNRLTLIFVPIYRGTADRKVNAEVKSGGVRVPVWPALNAGPMRPAFAAG